MGGTPITLNKGSGLRTVSAPPKACLQIELTTFKGFPNWKQSFSLRHEFGHMLYKEYPKTLNDLIKNFGVDTIKDFGRYEDEFLVHLLMVQKWEDDWLKEPVGFNDSMLNPALIALNIRKRDGKKQSMLFCIKNIVHLFTLLEIYANITTEKKSQIEHKKKSARK
jgi:hypothetical protein